MEKINGQEIYNFYSRKNKWMGLIDYKSLLFFIVYFLIIVKLVSLFEMDFVYKTYLIINLILPVIIFIFFNLNEESIIDKLFIIIKFYFKRKNYIKMDYYTKLDTKYIKK